MSRSREKNLCKPRFQETPHKRSMGTSTRRRQSGYRDYEITGHQILVSGIFETFPKGSKYPNVNHAAQTIILRIYVL